LAIVACGVATTTPLRAFVDAAELVDRDELFDPEPLQPAAITASATPPMTSRQAAEIRSDRSMADSFRRHRRPKAASARSPPSRRLDETESTQRA
jgi:hypothetical protein